MELFEALETYLDDTDQIHPLAKRQARMFCRIVSAPALQAQARILLLLNLAALNRGAPRAPGKFLLAPLNRTDIAGHADAYRNEHHGVSPVWEPILTGAASMKDIIDTVDTALRDPVRFAPLIGPVPDEGSTSWPLLVTNGGQIGFSRYWLAAATLERKLHERLSIRPKTVPHRICADALNHVFSTCSILDRNRRFHPRQIAAAALALRSSLLVVSGGPGTGKTKVVTQILRTLVHACQDIAPDRIALCAPTGRAKARLGESIDGDVAFLLNSPSATDRHPRDMALTTLQCKTLHALLGIRSDGTMKYNAANPLPYQVIVVDEASMVDLCLFTSLMEAAAPDCRIILVGDMHQLPSVEAGAVLGNLTEGFSAMEHHPTLTGECATWLHGVTRDIPVDPDAADGFPSLVLSDSEILKNAGLPADHCVILTRSYRSTRAIVDISADVNRGDGAGMMRTISNGSGSCAVSLDERDGINPVGEWLRMCHPDETADSILRLIMLDTEAAVDPAHPGHAQTRARLDAAFCFVESSRILTLTNNGLRGRVAINELADRLLRPRYDNGSTARFFHGQQVILNRNLHALDLYNGDTGLVVKVKNGGLGVVFRRGAGYIIHPLDRLSGIEPAFAITVHKAQGSEFDAVLLVLPEHPTPLHTRQIVYTGITRARTKISILGTKALLLRAINTKEERPGGISLLY